MMKILIHSYIVLCNFVTEDIYLDYHIFFILLLQNGGREVSQPITETFSRKFSDLLIRKY